MKSDSVLAKLNKLTARGEKHLKQRTPFTGKDIFTANDPLQMTLIPPWAPFNSIGPFHYQRPLSPTKIPLKWKALFTPKDLFKMKDSFHFQKPF